MRSLNGTQRVVELDGATVLPGLWDAHLHLGAVVPPWEHRFGAQESEAEYAFRCVRKAWDNLQAGVTSARTMGDRFNADLKLKSAIDQGFLSGPRLFVAGDSSWSMRAAGPDAFREHARALLRAGVDVIKLFATGGIPHRARTITHTTLSLEELRAAIEEAHRWDKTACVHAMGDQGVIMAAEAGADSIEHGFVLGERGIQAMVDHGAVFSPQMAVTAAWTGDFMHGAGCFPEWMIDNAVEAGRVHHQGFRKAVEAGVPVVTGVDNLPRLPLSVGIETFEGRPAIVAEIRLMAENGLTPMQALQAATRNPARLLQEEDHLGTLEIGKLADVIAVAGNPLSDLNVLANVRLVMKGGHIVRAQDKEPPRGRPE
jgi:imidazolonepropionase-like amidohydrolase